MSSKSSNAWHNTCGVMFMNQAKVVEIEISNSLLGKYCQELNYKTAQEVNNAELMIWLNSRHEKDDAVIDETKTK